MPLNYFLVNYLKNNPDNLSIKDLFEQSATQAFETVGIDMSNITEAEKLYYTQFAYAVLEYNVEEVGEDEIRKIVELFRKADHSYLGQR